MISFVFRGMQRAAISSGGLRSFTTFTVRPVISGNQCRFTCVPSFQVQPFMRTASAAAQLSAQPKHPQGSNSLHWTLERVCDVALLPLLPFAFYTDNRIANYALIMLVGIHVHWGMESIVVDYMRPRVVGKAGYYTSLGFVYLLTFGIFAGLLRLNYSEVPPTKAIKKLWTL